MKKEDPNYYAVIPAEVRYCENITPNAKLLYGEITALCNKQGYCWASNEYFKDLYKVKKDTISVWIRSLKANKFIFYEIKGGSQRKMYLKSGSEKSRGGSRKIAGGGSEKSLPSIIQDNNTNKEKDFEIFYKAFPIKKGEEQAKKTWNKLNKEKKLPKLNVLLKAIELQIAEKKQLKDKEGFAPNWKYPSSWLNAFAWKDEITKIKPWR